MGPKRAKNETILTPVIAKKCTKMPNFHTENCVEVSKLIFLHRTKVVLMYSTNHFHQCGIFGILWTIIWPKWPKMAKIDQKRGTQPTL